MPLKILGSGRPMRLFVAGLHGNEWKDTSSILENIEAPKTGTLAVIPLVNKENYISTLDDNYFIDIGQKIITAIEELEPEVYIELHSYSAENQTKLTDPERINRVGVPAFSQLDNDVLLGSVVPYIRKKYFPMEALCLTFEIQKGNPDSKKCTALLIDRVKELSSKEEFIKFMLQRYPEQAKKVIEDYKNFYGLQNEDLPYLQDQYMTENKK
ncbi:DUF2119 domain-containing protein [Methanolobus sp. ZRKC3]|uniref:DUF2119 domain-containing protein n=1 Tax=Methanolobus sp. ZRKC3 TaxID=3125786 RepID=UPI003249F716